MWRNCLASLVLLKEVNEKYPNRSKVMDGTIGDEAHASRKSDHNPWIKDANGIGVVRARDIDVGLSKSNPKAMTELVEQMVAIAKQGDARFWNGGYIIFKGKIYSEISGFKPRDYHGSNPHTAHAHFSFSRSPLGYDDEGSFGVAKSSKAVMAINDRGQHIAVLADIMNILAAGNCMIPEQPQMVVPKESMNRDKYTFTKELCDRVKAFQTFMRAMWDLNGQVGPAPSVDGIVGQQTIDGMYFWTPIALQKK